ncbi:MAG: hypothetical protein HOG71_09000 [Bacteroidetes bacterium]|nr:hypothetical protein [Bacteroidota bacterium]
MKTTLLYGCKIGEPSYMKEVLYECDGYVNSGKLMSKGEKWAKINNYDRLEIRVIELGKPDFGITVEI